MVRGMVVAGVAVDELLREQGVGIVPGESSGRLHYWPAYEMIKEGFADPCVPYNSSAIDSLAMLAENSRPVLAAEHPPPSQPYPQPALPRAFCKTAASFSGYC